MNRKAFVDKAFLLLIGALSFLSVEAHSQLSKSSPFLVNKVQIQISADKSSSENTFGLALIKSDCFKNQEQLLPQWLRTNQFPPEGLSARSVAFSLRDVSEKMIQLEVDNPCILGFDNDGIAYSTRWNDPLLNDQLFLPYIGFQNYQLRFESPLFKDLKPVIVAVVDSGVSQSHPDFLGRFWRSEGNQIGYNFIDSNFEVEDGLGHGSHVAGLISAVSNNGVGGVGISQAVRLMILKTQDDSGRGSVGDVADAIRFAADQGADVINLSLAIQGNPSLIREAVDYALEKGCFLVASAGNSGAEITPSNFVSPAGLAPTRPGLVSVASVDSESGVLSSFSNRSNVYTEVAAPGSHGSKQILSTYKNERYFSLAGTSMSAPQVAGAVAQIISYFKSYKSPLLNVEIERFLLDHSKTNERLLPFVKLGKELDLDAISQSLVHHHQLSSDGGLDE
ncbi:S8 family serine peptidase [bacterium]|nr:S8 family serine peptidase [bacterium]